MDTSYILNKKKHSNNKQNMKQSYIFKTGKESKMYYKLVKTVIPIEKR